MKNSPIKVTYLFYLLALTVLSACQKDDSDLSYPLKARVIGQGLDCGETYLIEVTESTIEDQIPTGTYYADGLGHPFTQADLEIELNARVPRDDEEPVCTAMGQAYPHVVVFEVVSL